MQGEIMKKRIIITIIVVALVAALGVAGYMIFARSSGDGSSDNTEKKSESKRDEVLTFVDAHGNWYQTIINPSIPKNPYDKNKFVSESGKMRYDDGKYTSRLGVDVSEHQGDINWQEVKNSGIDFAFIRIGYRGYGEAGIIKADARFDDNIAKAKAAGVDVGVYFFSQAINEDEAREEARFVLERLQGRVLDLPVVYDPENILDDVARTDNVTPEQFTKNTIAFNEEIKAAGYKPMIYSNMLWEAFQLDMTKLLDYPVWYADYEPKPQTPYDFSFWQYSEKSTVPGISGIADMNIQILKK